MTTSAFGIEHELVKAYVPGTITLHNESAKMHSRKKASGYRQVAGGVVVAGAGATAHQNADNIGRHAVAMGKPSKYASEAVIREAKAARTVRRLGVGGMIAGGALATVGAGRAIYHGHKQNAQTKKAQAARMERGRELEDRDAEREHKAQHGIVKSAFGVEHENIEKNILTSGLKMGQDALKGVKAGIGGWHESGGAAVKLGQNVGSGAMKAGVKLKPLVNTPGKAAATAGGGAAAGGFMLGHKSNN